MSVETVLMFHLRDKHLKYMKNMHYCGEEESSASLTLAVASSSRVSIIMASWKGWVMTINYLLGFHIGFCFAPQLSAHNGGQLL